MELRLARQRGRGLNRLAPVLRLPLGPLRKPRPQAWEGARSCNLAVWRSDLDRVDGFDASFSGWGKEDSDLRSGCCTPACGGRTAHSRPACCICGIRRPTAAALPTTKRGSTP